MGNISYLIKDTLLFKITWKQKDEPKTDIELEASINELSCEVSDKCN